MVRWTLSLDPGELYGIRDMMGTAGLPTYAAGETLTFSFNFRDDVTAHQQVLREFGHAGAYDTYQTIEDEYYYRPQRADSPLIGLEATPDPNQLTVPENIPQVWGLIESGADATPDTSNRPLAVAIDVFVLARRDDYADRAAVEQALAVTGP